MKFLLPLPPGPFKAYLFDCDGTIADSMPIHYLAWQKALGPHGCPFPKDIFYGWAGIPVPKTIEMLNDKYGLKMPVAQVVEARESYYFETLPQVQPHVSVVEHIHDQHGKIPFAVVSGSPRASVIKTLTALKLLDRFEVILGAEDYAHGKPNPDCFLAAAAHLKIAPKDCLVFEDADMGIEAARAAGMAWVRVPQAGIP